MCTHFSSSCLWVAHNPLKASQLVTEEKNRGEEMGVISLTQGHGTAGPQEKLRTRVLEAIGMKEWSGHSQCWPVTSLLSLTSWWSTPWLPPFLSQAPSPTSTAPRGSWLCRSSLPPTHRSCLFIAVPCPHDRKHYWPSFSSCKLLTQMAVTRGTVVTQNTHNWGQLWGVIRGKGASWAGQRP